MQIIKWAAVAVTALFALMNVGAVAESELDASLRAGAAVLAVIGAVAAFGLATDRSWGRVAVVAAGALNVAAAALAMVADEPGAVIGIVVGGVGVVLGALAPSASERPVRV